MTTTCERDAVQWPDRRLLDLFNIDLPIIQAPMAGANRADMVIAVSRAGGLGSLPCATLTPAQASAEIASIRQGTDRPINVNFFCHLEPEVDQSGLEAWRRVLAAYYEEFGVSSAGTSTSTNRAPFDEAFCLLVEAKKPEVVSFHFGLPNSAMLDRVKATGAKIISTATTVAEAKWLEQRGVDAIIAMGAEAGGHQGNFLKSDMADRIGTLALVPQIVDAVDVPVIAAGGIADGRGVAAAFMLGAAGVQVGTAYLFTPEAIVKPFYRRRLANVQGEETVLTNVFSGRLARGIVNRLIREIGPVSQSAPPFPLAGGALANLRAVTEAQDNGDFSNMWCGQAARLVRPKSATDLTHHLAAEALRLLSADRKD